ncbi:MAG TPA: phosphatase PAP2 family protein [Anaerolineales bacterium]|nr:phosphatase PAP2 family protein [Anaerolineales bacterium]
MKSTGADRSSIFFQNPYDERSTSAGIILLATWGLLSILFMELAGDIWRNETFAWDAPVMLFIHSYSQPWLNSLMVLITQSGGWVTAVVFLGLVYWLRRCGAASWAWGAAISFLGAISLNGILKIIFSRPRPGVFSPLTAVHTYSFPSGHTVAAVSLYGFIAFALWRSGHKPWAILAGGWVLLIALSRVYLGVHYPSDVLGGIAFGGLWLLLVLVYLNRIAGGVEGE